MRETDFLQRIHFLMKQNAFILSFDNFTSNKAYKRKLLEYIVSD